MSGESPATYCRECGAELHRTDDRCPGCGAPQGRPAEPTPQSPPSQAGSQQPPPAEDDGRSLVVWAVVGVAGLLVAIPVFVVLAAVVAAFTLGLGDSGTAPPQVTFDYEYTEQAGELTVAVSDGDGFDADRVSFEGAGFDQAGTSWAERSGTDGTVLPGDQVTLTGVTTEFELELVWTAPDGEHSSRLSTRTGPAA